MRSSIDGSRRAGVTLIEMMVALAITLVMMAAVAQLFASISTSVSASRASIGLNETLRSARNKLQSDLAGVTAPMLPPLRPELGLGYFEYIEGPNNDSSAYNNVVVSNAGYAAGNVYGYLTYPTNSAVGVDTLTGDTDDILKFTVRSKDGQPFVGKFYSSGTFTTVESQMAEVVWFAVPNGVTAPILDTFVTPNVVVPVPLYTLYRRVLLVAPEYGSNGAAVGSTSYNNGALGTAPSGTTLYNTSYLGKAFFDAYDLSAHYDVNKKAMVLNTLSDLTKRECRFGNNPLLSTGSALYSFYALFPFPTVAPGQAATLTDFNTNANSKGINSIVQGLDPLDAASTVSGVSRIGEDVVLTNVLAFDVRLYDPAVPLYTADDGTVLNPADYYLPTSTSTSTVPAGFWAKAHSSGAIVGYGDFVDLGYGAAYINTFNNSTYKNDYFSSIPYGTSGGTPISTVPNLLSLFSGYAVTTPGNVTYTGHILGYPYVQAAVYDTWSLHYEDAGPWNPTSVGTASTYAQVNYSSSGSSVYESGSNGFDDDSDGVVDNPASPAVPAVYGVSTGFAASSGEMQYPAPYPSPLRGIQVKIRTYEPDSRQVREVTIVQDFLPQ